MNLRGFTRCVGFRTFWALISNQVAVVAQNLYVLLCVDTFTQLPKTFLFHVLCACEIDEQLGRDGCAPQQREVRQVGGDAMLGLLRGKNERRRLCDEVAVVECEVCDAWRRARRG